MHVSKYTVYSRPRFVGMGWKRFMTVMGVSTLDACNVLADGFDLLASDGNGSEFRPYTNEFSEIYAVRIKDQDTPYWWQSSKPEDWNKGQRIYNEVQDNPGQVPL